MKRFGILLVDDNPDHRFLVERALNGIDDMTLEISTVADGEEALRYLRADNPFEERLLPHMVLLDLRMPRMGGLEVLSAMRADERLKAMPVCVLTSSDRSDDIDQAFSLGTNAYVVKSGDALALRREIAAVRDFWTTVSRVPEPRG